MNQTRTPDGKLVDKIKELKVTTNAKFFEKVRLNTIKVYMSSSATSQFLMEF